jgi:hypothetical protein
MFTERETMKTRMIVLMCLLAAVAVGCGAPNYEGVSGRLELAVMNGEITQAQAEDMMATLAKTRFSERMDARRGDAPAKECKGKSDGECKGKSDGECKGKSDGECKGKSDGQCKRGSESECKSGEKSIDDKYKCAGFDDEVITKIRTHLTDSDFTAEQTELGMDALLQVAFLMREKGSEFEFNPERKAAFQEEGGFSDHQMAMLVGMSRRLSAALPEAPAKEASECKRDGEGKPEGECTRSGQRGQRGEHQRGARTGRSHGRRGGRRGAAVPRDPEAMMKMMETRIDAAVEAGHITQEEGDAKLATLRARMEACKQRSEGECDK